MWRSECPLCNRFIGATIVMLTSAACIEAMPPASPPSTHSPHEQVGTAQEATQIRVALGTPEGSIHLELDPFAAPEAVATVIERFREIVEQEEQTGLTFDHTWPRIEVGLSTLSTASGQPITLAQAIDAEAVGLHERRISTSGEAMNVWQFEFGKANREWKRRGARPAQFEEWKREFEQTNSADFLIGVSRKEINELLGYSYVEGLRSQLPRRGTVYLKKKSPTEAEAKLIVLLSDRPQLDGQVTVIGRVTAGLDVVERISIQPSVIERGKPSYKPVEPIRIQSLRIEDAPSSARLEGRGGG